MLSNLPLYFKCFFSDKENNKVISTYRINSTGNDQYPLQLQKLSSKRGAGWESLSIYAGVNDSVSVLLKELFAEELSDEVYTGQAQVDPVAIMDKLEHGDKLVSIYDDNNSETLRIEYDIAIEDVVLPKRKRVVRKPENW